MVIIPKRDHHLVIISEGQSCPTILVTTSQGEKENVFRLAFLPAWVNEFAFKTALLPAWAGGDLADGRHSAQVEGVDYSTPVMIGQSAGSPSRTPVFATGQASACWRVFELDGINGWPIRSWIVRDLIGPTPHPEPSVGWIQPADWPDKWEVVHLTLDSMLYPDQVREHHKPPHWWPY